MRNSKFMKIITVILALSLLAASAFALSALANEQTEGEDQIGAGDAVVAPDRVTVVSKNAAYSARTELVFAVKCDDLAENEEIYLLFFKSAPEIEGKTAEELYKSAYYRKTAYKKGETVLGVEGCELIASKGIAASEINDSLYVLPVIKTTEITGEDIAFTYEIGGELLEYSVRAYAEEKLLDETSTEEQKNLYNAIIAYGDAADKIFDTPAVNP